MGKVRLPPKFAAAEYLNIKAEWEAEGLSCPEERELKGGRFWREFPVSEGRRIRAWYKKVGDSYIRDYGIGDTIAPDMLIRD